MHFKSHSMSECDSSDHPASISPAVFSFFVFSSLSLSKFVHFSKYAAWICLDCCLYVAWVDLLQVC